MAPAPCFPPVSLVAPSRYFLFYPSLKCSNSHVPSPPLIRTPCWGYLILMCRSLMTAYLCPQHPLIFQSSHIFPPKLLFFLGPCLRDSPTIPTRALGLILEAPLPATLQLNGLFIKPPLLPPICLSAITQGPALVELGLLNPTMAVFLAPLTHPSFGS